MAGINIEFVSDVSKFIKGTGDIEQSLDDVSGSLDDLARDAQDAGDKAGRGISEGIGDELKDAELDLRRLADEAKDAGSDMEQYFDAAADEVKASLEAIGEAGETSLDDIADQAKRAGEDLERPFDDAAEEVKKSLEEIGDAAEADLEKVGDEAKDAGDELEDVAKNAEKKFRDAFDAVKKDARDAGDRVGKDIGDGFDRAGEGAQEFKDEAASTAREGAASFTGEFDDVADVIQETLANAFAGFGPAGAAAGVAAAVGAGMFYAAWQEKAEQTEDRIASMYEDMLESGNRFLSAQYINEGISQILNDDEAALISYAEAQKIATRTGLDLNTVVQAYAGDADAAAQVQGTLNEKITESEQAYKDAVENGANPYGEAIQSGGIELEKYRDTLGEVTDQTATAAEKADIYRESVRTSEEATRNWTQAQAEQTEAVAGATAAIEDNNEKISDNTARGEVNRGVLAGLAEDLLGVQQAGKEAGLSTDELTQLQFAQAQQFVDTAEKAGVEEQAAYDLAVQLGLIPKEVSTFIQAKTKEAHAALDAIKRTIEGLPDGVVSIQTLGYAQTYQYLMNIQAAIRGINGTRARVAMGAGGQGGQTFNSGGTVQRAASGRYITGPGNDIDDRVPVRLSPGEFVLDAQATQQIGVGNLQALAEGRSPFPGGTGGASADDIATALQRVLPDAMAGALDGASIELTGMGYAADAIMGRVRTEQRRMVGTIARRAR